jgi:hypothetical protein
VVDYFAADSVDYLIISLKAVDYIGVVVVVVVDNDSTNYYLTVNLVTD